MAKSSGKGEGKSTPTSTATDAAGITLGRGEYTTGATYNAQGQSTPISTATDAAGITLGRGEYTTGASTPSNPFTLALEIAKQQASGTTLASPTPATSTPSNPFTLALEIAKQKTIEDKQEKGILGAIKESPTPGETNGVLEGVAVPFGTLAGHIAGLFTPSDKSKGEGVSNPTYNPSITAMANILGAMKEGTKNAPSSWTIPVDSPNALANAYVAGTIDGLGHNDYTPGTPTALPKYSSGYINRGSTVSTTGTGGSISSGLSAPERDTESISLGVFDPDKANYDQDNWNRGMESQSSSLVSDEQCKQFAMRAFHEDSPAFKVVKTTIVKKLD